mmetsp:Transcript_6236/g.5596  ORF Transcript_6236/g.5596 Transcript_6236/m.5596 type:complete len:207 (-) Transcript_6236:564-1184(-)
MIEDNKDFNSVKLSSILLTSLFKLFFKRAPEIHKMLGQFMEQLIKNTVDTDLKQRAVFYYRLLKQDIGLAQRIVNGDYGKIEDFYEDKNEELREKLFLEFNSLSVVYQKPSERILKDSILKHVLAIEKKYYSRFKVGRKREEVRAIEDDKEENKDPESKQEVKALTNEPPPATLDDLLDFGTPTPAIMPPQEAQPNLLEDFGGPPT